MKVKELGLVWIVVKDIQAAIKYYTEVVGLKVVEFTPEYCWAELEGHEGGARLGIAQENPQEPMRAGQNGVVTFVVDNLEKTKAEMVQKGAKCEGDILDIPGHVKMQTVVDKDGNRFQMCELAHQHNHSCCSC